MCHSFLIPDSFTVTPAVYFLDLQAENTPSQIKIVTPSIEEKFRKHDRSENSINPIPGGGCANLHTPT